MLNTTATATDTPGTLHPFGDNSLQKDSTYTLDSNRVQKLIHRFEKPVCNANPGDDENKGKDLSS